MAGDANPAGPPWRYGCQQRGDQTSHPSGSGMTNLSKLTESALNEVQWATVRALSEELNLEQLYWLSGFFAGVSHGRGAARPVAVAVSAPSAAVGSVAQGVVAARRVTVLYGSETGNSVAVAQALAEQLGGQGCPVTLLDMAECKPRQFGEGQDLLIVTSTYGDGDPPQPAAAFFEWIEGRKAPRLDGVRYAVLALGDSTYEYFCAAGRRLDERLQALGAERLLPRIDCDVDYEEAAAAWRAAVSQRFTAMATPPTTAAVTQGAPLAVAPISMASAVYDKRHPFTARVIDNFVLNGRGSSKEVRHIELSLAGSGLKYEPGDALGLMPQNDPALVSALLDLTGLAGDAPVTLKGRSLPLARALAVEQDLVAVTPRFLEHWARLSGAGELQRLNLPECAAERVAFARNHHVSDVMRRYPVPGLDAASLMAALRPLQPRLYSIASSAAAVPDEVHLTVATLRYELYGQSRTGVASGYLAGFAAPDARVQVYVQPSRHFRLPADDAPILMIGAGTGIAPYRAFLQEREARGASGRAWLFFGDRRFRTDFLYQTEWQTWLKDDVLDRMDVAFSRDAHNGTGRVYVWHRLLERARDVYAWLESGAHVYVCGDAERMAPDVHRTLAEIVMEQGGRDREAAHDYLRRLQEDHRYQRDVY